jgi:hypothetical protein
MRKGGDGIDHELGIVALWVSRRKLQRDSPSRYMSNINRRQCRIFLPVLLAERSRRLLRIYLPVCASLFAVGCSTTCVDRAAFTGNVANYSTKPDHKAFYMSLDTKTKYGAYYSWGTPTKEIALGRAEQSCRSGASKVGGDEKKCFAVAVDNQQTVFDPTSYFCDTDPARAAQDRKDMLNAITGMATAVQRH